MTGRRRVRLQFDLRRLSPFERDVLRKTLEIPRGEARTYGWIAREIGRPGAVRAVGSALNKNPIPLLIPCHRVVRSDGQIAAQADANLLAAFQISGSSGFIHRRRSHSPACRITNDE